MLNCCKSEPKSPKSSPYSTPKSQYKYSFKQRSHVLVNTENTHIQPEEEYQIDRSKKVQHRPSFEGSTNRQQIVLYAEYQRLIREHEDLDKFVKSQVWPLQNQVIFYEKQIRIRERQIRQLGELLDAVKQNRSGFIRPNSQVNFRVNTLSK